MSDATTSRAPEPETVPLRKTMGGEKPPNAWAAGEAVPVRIAAERAEAEEREERLALVTGRRRARSR